MKIVSEDEFYMTWIANFGGPECLVTRLALVETYVPRNDTIVRVTRFDPRQGVILETPWYDYVTPFFVGDDVRYKLNLPLYLEWVKKNT